AFIYAKLSGQPLVSALTLLRILSRWWPQIVGCSGLLLLITIWSYHDYYASQRRAAFSLLKPVRQLRPEDLDFKVLAVGEIPSPEKRPYSSPYIPRRFVPYDQTAEQTPHPAYTEAEVLESLQRGASLVLIGQPT